MNLSNLIFVPGRGYFEKTPEGKADYSRPRNEAAHASPEEQARKAELKTFLESQYYNPNSGYQDQYASLFGNRNMYQGPQDHWIGALDSRMNERLQGNYGTGSKYEYVARNTNRDNQRQMYARNNIIEDMYRNGYSKHQISQHINGTANIADMTPDWADYDERMSGYYRGGPKPASPGGGPGPAGPGGISVEDRERYLAICAGYGIPPDPAVLGNQPSPGRDYEVDYDSRGNPTSTVINGRDYEVDYDSRGNPSPAVNPGSRPQSYSLFSPENQNMRDFISQRLQKSLFGKGMFGG